MNRYVANGSFGSRLCENAQPTQFRGTFDYSFLKRIEYGASWQVDFFAKEIFSSFHTASVATARWAMGASRPRAELRGPLNSPAYSITLSARSRTDCGMVMPSTFAALRLIVMPNFVGCSTGKSAGRAPCKIRWINTAAWRHISVVPAP